LFNEVAVTDSDEGLVEFARSGSDTAIVVLLTRYRHYARAKARAYFLAGADKEDIVQEGMIGLYKAIRDFDPDQNTAFRAFAELCITRQIITAIKTATRQKHQPLNSYVSLNRPLGNKEDDDRSLADSIETREVADPAELVISAEEVQTLKAQMGAVLSPFEVEVLEHYIDGRSYQQIADMLGRHVKSIDNALQRIKRKLERHIAQNKALPA
jgi:RNA polymerase sporulation-specific sigma factor